MEITRIIMIIAVCYLYCHSGQSIIIESAVGGFLVASVGYMAYCRFNECCTDKYIPADFALLDRLLADHLHGQHLAHQTVLHALRSHVNTKERKKALAMSFHGLPGTGKNFVSDFIVKALYTEGEKSQYVHYYNGQLRFRSEGLVEQYKGELQASITKHLQTCPRSIFIFDEVEKIPKGTLDILVPFLDYHPKIRDTDATQAIFIFLSNTGSPQITNHLVELWEDGKTRTDVKLQDLEKLLALAAFNEKGGFHKSDTIDSSLIDHYIPFLPLEEEHVRKCIVDAFRRRNVTPNDGQIEEAKSHLTFGPHPYNLYSTGGCKRLDQKVGKIIHGHSFN